MYGNNLSIKSFDDDLWQALEKERIRQEQHIELIASENYASPRILEAQGSVLTNKYAEGYPGKRYYGGCEFVDIAEQLAIERAKELFKADYANVQPHSGASANAAVFLALLNAGDKILGMSLDHGGHLTHGSKVNFSGKIYESYSYGINPTTGDIDYDQVEALAKKKKITFRKSALALYDYHQELEDKRLLKNNPYGRLIVFCTLPHLKRKNFDNLLNIWKQLPFINLKKTISYKQKQLPHAAKKVLSREQKEKILRKKYS